MGVIIIPIIIGNFDSDFSYFSLRVYNRFILFVDPYSSTVFNSLIPSCLRNAIIILEPHQISPNRCVYDVMFEGMQPLFTKYASYDVAVIHYYYYYYY